MTWIDLTSDLNCCDKVMSVLTLLEDLGLQSAGTLANTLHALMDNEFCKACREHEDNCACRTLFRYSGYSI